MNFAAHRFPLIFFFALTLVCLSPIPGAAQPQLLEKRGSPEITRSTPVRTEGLLFAGSQPFDMVHYDLDLHFAMKTADMGGTVTMSLVPTTVLSTLTLNAVDLQLDSIQVNGIPVTTGVTFSGEDFVFTLPFQAAVGETLTVAIQYHRPPGLSRPSGRQGYYYFVPDTAGLLGLPDTLGYTMSEPSDARFWLPCYDEPWDKATLDLRATVPAGFIAASNGVLLGTMPNSDGTVTWHWKENHQIATYLIAVTISKWAVSSYPFVRGPGDTIPVQYYVWRPDSSRCASYLPTVAMMIGNLSKLFGPYPFDKYGMTGVAPFLYGGMEHQTITTLARSVETDESVVVHELGHQWWGDDVTCGQWQDIWLNESFASYVEALWKESLGGAAALHQYMVFEFENFQYGSWQGTIYDPVEQGFGIFPTSVYSKGAWVLHTLRGVVGDSVFFASLRAYRARYEGGAAVTDEFRGIVESVSHRDMRWFFDEWIFGKGWPQYAIRSSYTGGAVQLTIYQQQDTTWPTFTMPIQLRALADGHDTTFVVQDSLRSQTFVQPLSFAPDSIAFDPGDWILKQMVNGPTGVTSQAPGRPLVASLEQNFPNPFNPTTVISGQWTVNSVIRLAIYDVLGREVALLADGMYPAGRYSFRFDGSKLSSGVYFYRLTAGKFSDTRSMTLVK